MSCPDPDELARFADGLATAAESEALSKHIDTCAACREVLVTLAKSSVPRPPPAPVPDDLPEKGAVIGRYVVLDSRGAGGMGLVVSAFDPQLDRKVALKLVRPDVEALGGAENTRARLVREAQLMARVRHPNVLTVYEVGQRGDQVFIAMELVEGHTLRAWLKEQPRSPAEVLDVFLQAGRALAAAHAAGVVHRDFKPDNVLVDASGRAQVTDFGLAWSGAPPSGTPLERASPSAPAGKVTGIVGTPAYMAPEQLKGLGSDGRSDQFSFCVALWEALTGARPYQASDMRGLERAIDARAISPPQKRLPGRLESALRRGLEPSPEARFPTMEALLAEVTPRSRRALWGALAASAVAALATFAANRPGAGCEPPPALAEAWSPARRAEVEQGFGAGAKATFAQVAQALEQKRGEWRQAWTSSCEATRVQRTQSEEVLARQRVCLDARLDELRALAELFQSPTPGVLENAGLAVSRLKPAQACLTGQAFDALPLPQDARPRATIAQARLELARAEARRAAGEAALALQSADAALATARLANYPPIEAEAHLARVDPLRDLGRYDEAAKELEAAALAAEAGRHFEAQLLIAVKHIRVMDSARRDEAEKWIRRAENILAHSPRPDLQAQLDLTLSIFRLAQRRTAESRARATAAQAWFEKSGDVANALAARHIAALALRAQGKASQALGELSPALEDYRRALGAAHPMTLHVAQHLAEVFLDLARPRDAAALLESPAMLTPGRLTTSWEVNRLGLLGTALAMEGRLAAAAALHQQALERARAQTVGQALVPGARRWLLPTLRAQQDFARAREEASAALAELEAAEHPAWLHVHLVRLELAEVEAEAGKGTEALARAKEAAEALGPLLDAASPEAVGAQLALARVALAAKAPQVAAEAMERLRALPLEAPARARAALLLSRARQTADPELVPALEQLQAARVFPLERLAALAQGAAALPALAPCAGNPAWAEVELGPRAAALRDAAVKRHCR